MNDLEKNNHRWEKAWLEETEERNQKFIFADVLLERREEK